MQSFAVFAQARSGSSTLLKALQCHPQLRILEEPFHDKYHLWNPDEPNYRERIKDIPSLDQQLDALYLDYDGIKILDYQLPQALYRHLLLKPDLKIIALRRRNLLQQIVSGFIAEQTGIWKRWESTGSLAAAYRHLQAIDLPELAQRLAYRKDLNRYYAAVLAEKQGSMCLALEYERLYTPDVASNRASLHKVFTFLGVQPWSSDAMDALLDPDRTKLNDAGRYLMLPNAREIERHFGSDEHGWLLAEGAG